MDQHDVQFHALALSFALQHIVLYIVRLGHLLSCFGQIFFGLFKIAVAGLLDCHQCQ